ncbi:Uncharacterised protein g182 [Pycnogonum litorale]
MFRQGFHAYVIIVGCFIVGVAYLLLGPVPFLGLEPKLWLLIFSAAVVGIGGAFVYIPALGMMIEVLKKHDIKIGSTEKSFVASSIVFASNVGSFLGPLIAGASLDSFGFEWTTLVFAVITLSVGILDVIYLSCLRCRKERRGDYETLKS